MSFRPGLSRAIRFKRHVVEVLSQAKVGTFTEFSPAISADNSAATSRRV